VSAASTTEPTSETPIRQGDLRSSASPGNLDGMDVSNAYTIEVVDAAAGRDAAFVDRLAHLVNEVYSIAEAGLWQQGTARTSSSELAALIDVGEIFMATDRDRNLVGCVQIRQISDDAGEFGMLVAAPDRRSAGIGRGLVEHAEELGRERGLRTMQLELLVPREWQHPSKEFLRSWYGRIGYVVIEHRKVADTHPHLGPLLATPCEFEVREKAL
jgi:GNAT superfamily N-acetyltransferase